MRKFALIVTLCSASAVHAGPVGNGLQFGSGIAIGADPVTAPGAQPAMAGNTVVSIGAGANCTNYPCDGGGSYSVAIGEVAMSTGMASTVIGSSATATATATGSVVLGNMSSTDRAYTVSVGSAGNERTISNVAAGTAGTDAVNLNQLNAAVAGAGGADITARTAAATADGKAVTAQNTANTASTSARRPPQAQLRQRPRPQPMRQARRHQAPRHRQLEPRAKRTWLKPRPRQPTPWP